MFNILIFLLLLLLFFDNLYDILLFFIAGSEWFPDEINDGYLEHYFFLLAAFMLIDFGIFVVIAKKYKYVNQYALSDVKPRTSSSKGNGKGERMPLLSESEM